MKREYKKCEWCGRTVDITNIAEDFCKQCEEYGSYQEFRQKLKIVVV